MAANDKVKEFEKNIEMGKEKALENVIKQIEKDFGKGSIMKLGESDLGVSLDIINKNGAWFSYKTNRLGQGKENVKTMLKENPETADEIERAIKDKITGGVELLLATSSTDDSVEEEYEEDDRFSLAEEV